MKTFIRNERESANAEVLEVDLPFLVPEGHLIRTPKSAATRVIVSSLDFGMKDGIPVQRLVVR